MFVMTFLYIDPGSGSLLFQLLLSGILTIIVFFKRIAFFFRSFFISKKEGSDFLDKED